MKYMYSNLFLLIEETVPEYKPPFERELGPIEPENLHAYVVQNKSRPLFPDAWKHNHLVSIEDCTRY